MVSSQRAVAVDIADYMLSYDWNALPENIQKETKRALLNYLACAIGGAITPTMQAAVSGIKTLDSSDEIPIAGRTERCGISNAALLGAISASAHTFDDTHLATITHPTAPVASACLATAYRLSLVGQHVRGTDLLAAIAIGIEIQCRTSNVIRSGGTAHMGWYITGLSGGVGAAIAVGHLLKLDHEQFVSAIGLAGTQASGLRATHGSMAIAYVPGLAGRSGVDSAYLAKSGFNCSPIVLDGRNGLLEVLGSSGDPATIVQGLGERFELLNNAYKPYPCGIVIHPSIDGCIQLIRQHVIEPENIDQIFLDVHPDAMTLTWRKHPETELDAQVSLFHWVAATLVFKNAGIDEGKIEAVQDKRVRDLQNNIHVNTDKALRENQARVSVLLKDGRRLSTEVSNATGSITNPMTTEQLVQKFNTLARPVIGSEQSAIALERCLNIDQATNSAELLRLASQA